LSTCSFHHRDNSGALDSSASWTRRRRRRARRRRRLIVVAVWNIINNIQ